MTDYRGLIEVAAHAHGLDPNLVEAVCLTESSGRTDAFRFEPAFWNRYLKDNPKYHGSIPRRVSSSYGLMQVMFPVARELGFVDDPEDLFKPHVGLYYGCKKLSALLRWSDGDVDRALEAYNGGKGSVGSPATRRYVLKVRDWLAKVEKTHA
jgi:soluble lytic murein transglycosylase-like protein